MKRLGLCAVLLGFVNCMGVEVPEDYVSDLYYGETPKVVSATPSTSMQWTTLTQSLRIQFSNPMAASSLVIDSGGACSGNLQLYDNNNAGCRIITGVSSEKRDSVFTATIAGDLDPNSDYTITVRSSVTDFRGRALGSDATFAFKSGIPSGSEPFVISVTPSGGFNSSLNFTVVFSRPIAETSVAAMAIGSCAGTFVISSDNFSTSCNPSYNGNGSNAVAPVNGASSTYQINYKNLPTGAYVFRVKAGLIDKFGVATVADYTFNYP